jgi:hypothetical protein
MSWLRFTRNSALALPLLLSSGWAHYHFLHYPSLSPLVAAPEKFDLHALPNATVSLFVSNQRPWGFAEGESFASLLGQIRAAAKAWNDVPGSALRISYAGLITPDTPQSSASIQVIFDELPPGLIAMAGPVSRGDMISAEDAHGQAPFVPITTSLLVLSNDFAQRPLHTDSFFLTLVHELGHTLGLQHTLSSSVMSTTYTRATTRSQPLAADDAAGLALLYPASGFSSRVGAITGRVTASGVPIHMASVVAISPSGAAVSSLSAPDGSYRLDGLVPGRYYLYAHPLPPGIQAGFGPADIVLPTGPDGDPIPASEPFNTIFYPGVTELGQAHPIDVAAGGEAGSIDFSVTPAGSVWLYGVTTYSFPAQVAVKPAFINTNGKRLFLVASGAGIVHNNAPVPGLRVSVLGGSAVVPPAGVSAYASAPQFLQVNFEFHPFAAEGPRHLIFSKPGALYILPAGLNIVKKQPPSITSVTPFIGDQNQPLVRLAGSFFSAASRVLFDGLPARIAHYDPEAGEITVEPPPGDTGHQAHIVITEPDGQSSLFTQPAPTYTYPPAGTPSITLNPRSLPAGAEAMVEFTGAPGGFYPGQTVVGFGSSDVVVRRTWVLDGNRMLANVRVAPTAPVTETLVSATTGLQLFDQPFGFRIDPARTDLLVLDSRAIDPITNFASIYPGGRALLSVRGLPEELDPAAVSLTLNDRTVQVSEVSPEGLVFLVPAGFPEGPAVARLSWLDRPSLPVVLSIDPPPPVISRIVNHDDLAISSDRPATPQGFLRVVFVRRGTPALSQDRVTVLLSGQPVPLHELQQLSDQEEYAAVIQLPKASEDAESPIESYSVVVSVDGRPSVPVRIPVTIP